jgi:alpha-beta hydrolase superfamily lysophospholipase
MLKQPTATPTKAGHAPGTAETPPGSARARGTTLVVRLVRAAVLAYVAWVAALWFVQDRILFVPHLAGEGLTDAAIAAEPRIVRRWLAQDDGVETEAWLVRASQGLTAPRGLVVFTHGNAELIDHALPEAEEWTRRGFDVLLPEYRGYGRTGGTPGETRIVEDILAHLDAEIDAHGARPLVLHGRSLGTGVAAQVALRIAEGRVEGRVEGVDRDALDALILESPFTSIAAMAAGFGAPGFVVRHPFRTDRALPALACPILILHARNDEVVPIAHGRALSALHPKASMVELAGSHNSGIAGDPAYWSAIDRMLAD